MLRGARALAACIVLTLACACCSSEQDTCASNLTKVCLADGTTCTCAPSCSQPTGCDSQKLCRKGACSPCTSQTCECNSNVCIPASWSSGETVSFE